MWTSECRVPRVVPQGKPCKRQEAPSILRTHGLVALWGDTSRGTHESCKAIILAHDHESDWSSLCVSRSHRCRSWLLARVIDHGSGSTGGSLGRLASSRGRDPRRLDATDVQRSLREGRRVVLLAR